MAATFQLQIVTPERAFFDAQAEMVVFDATDGEMGILPGHAPMVAALQDGAVRIRQAGTWREAAASEGFAIVEGDKVIIMVQTVEWPEEIDANRAERDRQAALERLRQQRSMHEYHLARSMLTRAMVRLRVSGRNRMN